MKLTIRQATLADEPFLWEMLYQALFVPDGESAFPREIIHQPEIRQYVEYWGAPDDFGLLAFEADKPIGAVWVRCIKAYGYVDDKTPELSIAVLPAYRGHGIGTRMLNELFVLLRMRYDALSLSVASANPALRLYQRLGFVTVSDDGNSVVMKRLLD